MSEFDSAYMDVASEQDYPQWARGDYCVSVSSNYLHSTEEPKGLTDETDDSYIVVTDDVAPWTSPGGVTVARVKGITGIDAIDGNLVVRDSMNFTIENCKVYGALVLADNMNAEIRITDSHFGGKCNQQGGMKMTTTQWVLIGLLAFVVAKLEPRIRWRTLFRPLKRGKRKATAEAAKIKAEWDQTDA